jgi:hypothetical protein
MFTTPEGRDLTHTAWKCGTCYQHDICEESFAAASDALNSVTTVNPGALSTVVRDHSAYVTVDAESRAVHLMNCSGAVVQTVNLSAEQAAVLLGSVEQHVG